MTAAVLQAVFDEETAGPRVAALAAGVVSGGDVLFQSVHHCENTTLFRVASVTKTFTATAVMQLVAEGRIGLDDSINSHLLSLRVAVPDGAPEVTVRHLLTHRAGLREPLQWTDLARPSRFLGPRVGRRVPALLDLYRGGITTRHTPGDGWSYSNDGYAILGQLVEDVTGTPYAAFVRETVWQPRGMCDSTFAPALDGRVAAGHRLVRGRLRRVPARAVVKAAAGGAYCSLRDMLRWASALDEEMFRPQVLLGDRLPYNGLGVFLDCVGGHRIVYHPGDFPGYEAALFVAPDDGVGAVVLCNSSARGVALRLARELMTRALGVEVSSTDAPTASVAARVVGDYVAEPGWRGNLRVASMTGGRLTVAVREGSLVLRSRFGAMHRPSELAPVAGSDDLHFQLMLRGMPYDGVPLDVVFAPGPNGTASRVDLGMIGARFHRR